METWDMVRDARQSLCGILEGLADEQWDAQSLCTEWRVRDVVAHVISTTQPFSPLKVLAGMAGAGFNIMRYQARAAREAGNRPPSQLLSELRSAAGIRRTAPGLTPEHMLVDALAHTGDICRPLGIPQSIPAESFSRAMEKLMTVGFPVGAKRRVAGLRLRATDVDWSAGSGPEVAGPAPALLLAVAGRPAGLADLAGDGRDVFASRLPSGAGAAAAS